MLVSPGRVVRQGRVADCRYTEKADDGKRLRPRPGVRPDAVPSRQGLGVMSMLLRAEG